MSSEFKSGQSEYERMQRLLAPRLHGCFPPKGVYRFNSHEEADSFDEPYRLRRERVYRGFVDLHPEFLRFFPGLFIV